MVAVGKICFKCNVFKDIEDFYVHQAMGDRRLGKCKDCTKNDASMRERELRKDPSWIESERKRGREKHHRLYSRAEKEYTHKYDDGKNWAQRFPEKRKASLMSQHLKKPFAGAEKHHWSYNSEHYKDVIWLTKKHHMKGHRFIVYDQVKMMYRRTDDNALLDTKENHEQYIRFCIETKED